MLCECIPVGINNGGIPIAIGDAGFIIEDWNVDVAVESINKALKANEYLGKKARKRIIEKFSLEKREGLIFNVITKEL
jgi:glycosyltransferase involved in cell wall biosynthesis